MVLRVGVFDGPLAEGRRRGVPRPQRFDVGGGKGFNQLVECRQAIGSPVGPLSRAALSGASLAAREDAGLEPYLKSIGIR